jgi:ABC-type multidrug transport system permease subunit
LLEFLPVFLMFPLVMQCMVGITSSVVAAKEKGVLRHLALTPVTMARFVLASLIVRGGAGVVQVILILAPLVGFRLIALNLELVLTVGFSALFICSISGIAFLLAGLLPTVNVASQITSAIAVAMFYLSGGLPGTDRIAAIDMVAPLLPIRYFTDSVGQLLLSQTGRLPLVVNAAALIGFTLVLVAITSRTFRIESNKK